MREDGRIEIEFGAVPNVNEHVGGFLPIIWVNGHEHGSTYATKAFDEDVAIAGAEELAKEEAARYGGD